MPDQTFPNAQVASGQSAGYLGDVATTDPAGPGDTNVSSEQDRGELTVADHAPSAGDGAGYALESHDATTGAVTLLVDGIETAPIAWDASSDDIRDAIAATNPGRFAGHVTVGDD